MSSTDHDRLTELFLDAVALDGDSRRAFMERVRAEQPGLHEELESLLCHDATPPEVLKTGGGSRDAWIDHPSGARIGPYRLLRRIGEGGMGVVYLAEQVEPLRRLVALKLIRPGFDSRNVAARFEAERQVLERMDHPNVARVLDAGMTEDLRPYFVMEHVRGETITRFADRNRLDVRARMRLFLPVCDAVHHAHQNAILHRDVKPSNVLVATIDGIPVPKVIDFGIAKALSSELGAAPTLTEAGQLIGTPGYMSPEQALSALEGVDIRSDVYSLGCLLHELLVGCPPFEASFFRHLGSNGIRELLLRFDPPSPSVRSADLGPIGAAVLDNRRTDARSLARQLRGDIDGIVLKAIARERSDRYASAHELGADIRRFLNDEPVEARPPSASYRLRKLAARHRAAAAVVTATVPLVLAFGVVMAFQAYRIAQERDRAEEISEFLLRFYELPIGVTGRHGPCDPSDLLRGGLARTRRQLGDRPVLAARLEHAVGESLRGTGDAGTARPVVESAYVRLGALLGPEDPRTLSAGHDLAKVLRDLERYPEAESQLRRVLAARRRILGEAHPDTLRTSAELGILCKEVGRPAEAADLLAAARSGLADALGPESPEVALTTGLLGSVLLDLRRLDEAAMVLEEAVRRLDDGSKEKGIALYNLGCVHALSGERDAALEYLRAAVARGFVLNFYADPNLAPLHRDPDFATVAKSVHVLNGGVRDRIAQQAETDIRLGRFGDAEGRYRAAIAALPADRRSGLRSRLGALYLRQGRYAEARPLLEEDVEAARAELGPGSVWTGIRSLDLVQVHLGRGDKAGALAVLDEATRIFEGSGGLGSRGWVLYARACREAILGRRSAALRFLAASADAGFAEIDRLLGDLAFGRLRSAPEFRGVVETLRRRYEFP